MLPQNVNEIQKELKEKDFTQFVVDDVPSESWIMTLLPYLLIFGAIFILFMIMSNNAGAAAKTAIQILEKAVKNFSTEEDNHMTFENVAGLERRKRRNSRNWWTLRYEEHNWSIYILFHHLH